MEASINPSLTLCTEEGQSTEARIVERVQNAIRNGGQCVYNVHVEGDETVYDVPKLVPIAECFNPIGEDELFAGWKGFEKIQMIDFDYSPNMVIAPAKLRELFDEPTRNFVYSEEMHDELHKIFFDRDTHTVGIRVDYPNGNWFGYLVSNTL